MDPGIRVHSTGFNIFIFSYILSFLPSLPFLLCSPPFLIASFSTFPIVFTLPLPPPSSSFFSLPSFCLHSLPYSTPLYKSPPPFFLLSSSFISLFYLPSPPCFHLSSSPNDKTPVKKTVLNTSGWDTQQTLL